MGNKLREIHGAGNLELAHRIYRDFALFIEADTTIADSVMGRGTRNKALLKAIKDRLNELEILE